MECGRYHYHPRTLTRPILVNHSTNEQSRLTHESRTGLETQIHRPCIGDREMMLANGEKVKKSCHHLRMMKLPEGEVLQLISATSFTNSKASNSPLAIPLFTILCSVKPPPLKSMTRRFRRMIKRQRMYLFETGAGFSMWAVCPTPIFNSACGSSHTVARVTLRGNNILVIIHFKFAWHEPAR